jgi:hypothetical protein
MKAVKQAIRNQLIAAGVNGGVSIFDTLAPAGTAYPYVLFQYVSGGDENLDSLDTRSELWQVKAVSNDHDDTHTLAEAIRAALHRQALSITGWQHLWTIQVDHIWLVEGVARDQVYHAGGTFRIRLHKV